MRPTVPRAITAVALVLLGWYAFVGGPWLGSSDTPESHFSFQRPSEQQAALLPVFPPAGHTFLGVETATGTDDFTDEQRFTAATGTRPSVYEFSAGWAVDGFSRESITRAAARGLLPIVSWEPWDFRSAGPTDPTRAVQPNWRLSTIADGRHDDYVRSWAQGIAGLGFPVVIRLAHEMNGSWYPWSEQVNGNRPGDYVRMWRHVHDVFAAAGARNAIWLWSPNVAYAGSQDLASLYPGDAYVDWVGLSGYYGTSGQQAYATFDQIFGPTLHQLAGLGTRPVVIAETGATNAAGRRVEWIRDMFRALPTHPQIIGVVWFEADREIDWRIGSAPDAAAAFGEEAAAARFDTPWTPLTRPLTAVPS